MLSRTSAANRTRFNGLPRWLYTLGLSLALVSQLGVIAAQVGEFWQGQSIASHVEQSGTSRHFAHNEATCPACQARSMTGATTHAVAPVALHAVAAEAPIAAARLIPASEPPAQSRPRAPPTLV